MPVVVKGLKETMKGLRAIQPGMEKAMRTEIKQATKPVIQTSQSLVPQSTLGLSSWSNSGKKSSTATFPTFNRAVVVRGIKTQMGGKKANDNGFASVVRIVNSTRAGAIFEWAGRTNIDGLPWVGHTDFSNHKVSHSYNPKAGKWFISKLPELVGQKNLRGRIIYKAWNEDHGTVQKAVAKIADNTVKKAMGDSL